MSDTSETGLEPAIYPRPEASGMEPALQVVSEAWVRNLYRLLDQGSAEERAFAETAVQGNWDKAVAKFDDGVRLLGSEFAILRFAGISAVDRVIDQRELTDEEKQRVVEGLKLALEADDPEFVSGGAQTSVAQTEYFRNREAKGIAISLMMLIKAQEVVPYLVTYLTSLDRSFKGWAAEELEHVLRYEHVSQETKEMALGSLRSELNQCDGNYYGPVAAKICQAIGAGRDEQAIDVLEAALDRGIGNAAVALAEINTDKAQKILLVRVKAEETSSTRDVCFACGLARIEEAIPTLSEWIFKSQDIGVHANVIGAFGSMGGLEVVPYVVVVALCHQSTYVRDSAAKLLGIIIDKHDANLLFQPFYRGEEDDMFTAAVSVGLVGGSPAEVLHLLEGLSNVDEQSRAETLAIEVVKRMKSKEARNVLRHIAFASLDGGESFAFSREMIDLAIRSYMTYKIDLTQVF